jgi:hypothetical protein
MKAHQNKILPAAGRGTARSVVEGQGPTTPSPPPLDIHPIDCDCWPCLDADRTRASHDMHLVATLIALSMLVSGALIGAAVHLACTWLGARP